MKTFKQLIEYNQLKEGGEMYPADEMTMKELQIACYAAQNIIDRLEDGAMIQRWQISAIVKASEELSSVYTSISADEYDDPEMEDDMYYDEYGIPNMYGEETDYEVEVEGLPTMYVKGNSPSEVKAGLRKVVKNPDMIKGIERMTKTSLQQIFRAKASGKDEIEEVTTDTYHSLMLKALGKSRLPKDHGYTSAISNDGDFIVRDGGGRVVGRIGKGDYNIKK